MKKYGLTEEYYALLLEAQKGVCGICQQPPTKRRLLAVDHCHTTEKIRGLLCHRCNMALGLLQEDARILTRALRYLKT